MAEKPRVKAPKQRHIDVERRVVTPADADDRRRDRRRRRGLRRRRRAPRPRRRDRHGRGGGAREVRGGRLHASRRSPALRGRTLDLAPDGTSDKWNTDPPTSGPHFGIAAIFGIYDERAPARARRPQPRARRHLHLLRRRRSRTRPSRSCEAFYDDHQDRDDHGAARPARVTSSRSAPGSSTASTDNGLSGEVHARSTRTRSRVPQRASSSAAPSASTRPTLQPAARRPAYTRLRRGGGTGETRPP